MGSKYASLLQDGKIEGMELAALTRVGAAYKELLKPSLDKGIPVYQSADELFEAVEKKEILLDAVVIATPHMAHEEQAVRAFKNGLSVMSDKPAGVYTRQARRMNEAHQASIRTQEAAFGKGKPTIYGMVFNQRTTPMYQKIREIVQSKEYGELKRVNWVVTDWYRPNSYYASGTWRATWKKDGGGVLLNQCPHNLDLLQWICGMPKQVTAFCQEGRYHDIEVEDDVTAFLQWENGATGTFITSTGEAPGINRLEISLEEALIVCENGKLKVGELYPELGCKEEEYRKNSKEYFRKLKGTWKEMSVSVEKEPYQKILQGFSDAYFGKGELIASGEEGINSLYLSNAMYISSWSDKKIEIPSVGTEAELFFEQEFESYLNKKIEG